MKTRPLVRRLAGLVCAFGALFAATAASAADLVPAALVLRAVGEQGVYSRNSAGPGFNVGHVSAEKEWRGFAVFGPLTGFHPAQKISLQLRRGFLHPSAREKQVRWTVVVLPAQEDLVYGNARMGEPVNRFSTPGKEVGAFNPEGADAQDFDITAAVAEAGLSAKRPYLYIRVQASTLQGTAENLSGGLSDKPSEALLVVE
jgi:hypothetical protein